MRQLSINNKNENDFTVVENVKINKIDIIKVLQFAMILCLIAVNIFVFYMNNNLMGHLLPASVIVLVLLFAKNLDFTKTYK
ncbi:MAG: hypothetical protein HC798_04255 [Polaribacter sp.]|nr:hypothetical protein [Polaribacter sp.]